MDGNGARELARRLEERHGQSPPATARKAVLAADAAPIFHWLGIEPASASGPTPSTEIDDATGRPSA